MFFGLFWGDWTLLLLVPAMIFALVAQIKVQSSFAKYNKVQNSSGLSGADAARAILDRNGLSHVRVERVSGHLTDHYDPRANVIRLSESTYDSRSVAAVGVAAHEAGHAAGNSDRLCFVHASVSDRSYIGGSDLFIFVFLVFRRAVDVSRNYIFCHKYSFSACHLAYGIQCVRKSA